MSLADRLTALATAVGTDIKELKNRPVGTTGPAGGDLSGEYPDPMVERASGPYMTIAGRLLIPTPGLVGGLVLGETDAKTNLYTWAEDFLKTDAHLLVDGLLYANHGDASQMIMGDVGTGAPGLRFGALGTSSLYELAPGELRTPGKLWVGGDLYALDIGGRTLSVQGIGLNRVDSVVVDFNVMNAPENLKRTRLIQDAAALYLQTIDEGYTGVRYHPLKVNLELGWLNLGGVVNSFSESSGDPHTFLSTAYDPGNSYIRSYLGFGVYYNIAAGRWENAPYGGANGWSAIHSDASGIVRILAGESSSGHLWRFYTKEQFKSYEKLRVAQDGVTVPGSLRIGAPWTSTNINTGRFQYPGGHQGDRRKIFLTIPQGVSTNRRMTIAKISSDSSNWHPGGVMEITCRTDYYVGGMSKVMVIFGWNQGNEPTVEVLETAGPTYAVPTVTASVAAPIDGWANLRTFDVYVDVPTYAGLSVEIDTAMGEIPTGPFLGPGQFQLNGTITEISDPGWSTKKPKLNTDIITSAAVQTATGSPVNIAGAGWKNLPVGYLLSEPADAFTLSGGGVSIKEAGWYHVSATVLDSTPVSSQLYVAIDTDPNASDGSIANNVGGPAQYARVGADGAFKAAAGDKVYIHVWSPTPGPLNTFVTQFSIARIGGPQGPKGNVGGNALVPMDGWVSINPTGGAAPAFNSGFSSDPTEPVAIKKQPDGRVVMRGYLISPAGGGQPFTMPATHRPPRGYVRIPIIGQNAAGVYQGVARCYIGAAGDVGIDGLGTANRWDMNVIEYDTETVSQMMVGPKGDKGDTGGIDSYTTLNWNTAIIPGFYRSTNQDLEQTINGPGDQLNLPKTAGIVSANANGALVQRVWDLDFQVSYTRYRRGDGSWSTWAKELTTPPLFTEVMAGGATPQEGDERYFQNAAMKALGVMWRFRYNKTGQSVGKWEFVGGPEFITGSLGDITTASPTSVALTGGPTIVVPVSGRYIVGLTIQMIANQTNPGYAIADVFADNTALGMAQGFVFQGAAGQTIIPTRRLSVSLTAGQTLNIRVSCANSGSNRFVGANLELKPVNLVL